MRKIKWIETLVVVPLFAITLGSSAQADACSYTIDPSTLTQEIDGLGGNREVHVTMSPQTCVWWAVSNDGWIDITNDTENGGRFSGSDTVEYTVDPNPSACSRTGTMTIANETFTVEQSGVPCSYNIDPPTLTQDFEASGGSGTVNMVVPFCCSWTAVNNDPAWITITKGSSGSGNGMVYYNVEPNTSGSSRAGTMTIAGKTFTITQQGRDVNDGVEAIEADFWHRSGINGKGIKVAVIDTGFDSRDELTPPLTYETLIDKCSGPCTGDHGTAVAYTVQMVAPEAEIYLVHVNHTLDKLLEALDWCLDNSIDIVNISLSHFPIEFPPWFNPSENDTSEAGQLANKIRELKGNNIAVLVAAGNYKQKHYEGEFFPDASGFHKFDEASGDRILELDVLKSNDVVQMWLYTETGSSDFSVWVNFNNGHVEYDIEIETDEDEGYPHRRTITWENEYKGLKISGPASRDGEGLEFYIKHDYGAIKYNDPIRSLTYPAGVDAAITIGAASFFPYNSVADYSSQGPGVGPGETEIKKPDFIGPDGTKYNSGISEDWYGTSLAAPHVAGAIALLYEAIGSKDWTKAEKFLKAHSFKPDHVNKDQDNEWGHGAIKLRDPYECNNSFPNAHEILPGSYEDLICKDDDWYKVHVEQNSVLTVTIEFDKAQEDAIEGDLHLELYDENQDLKAESKYLKEHETIQLAAEADHWYYIKVYGNGNIQRNLYSMVIKTHKPMPWIPLLLFND